MAQQHHHQQQELSSPPPALPATLSQQPSQATQQQQARGDRAVCTDAERGWIFHRNREQPTPDPNEPPLRQIKFYLDRYRIKEALHIFFDDNTLNLLRVESDFMWDIIPIICKRLRGLCQFRFRVFEGCERMLCRIAIDEGCNPKEVLISFLAELSQPDGGCEDDNVFRAMIRPLEGTLLRINYPSPRDENLKWVLNVLMNHINNIELPQEYNLEGKKRLSLPNDPSVKRFIEVLPLLLNFIEEFDNPIDYDKSPMPILTESQIDEVFNGELVDDDIINEHSLTRCDGLDASVGALIGLMSRPLAFLDLTTQCPDLRLFANRCLNTLLKLRQNLFSPIYKRLCDKSHITELDWTSINNNSGVCNESTLSLATCAYIYRCERVFTLEAMQYIPQVITHESMLCYHVPYIVVLLERPEILVQEKGLILLESLLKKLTRDSLNQRFFDMFESSSLYKHIFHIMVFSPLCTNRSRAYEMFTCLCDLLTYDCKLRMFKYVLSQNDLRPSVRATCSIDQYRKHLTNVYSELSNLHQQLTATNTLKIKQIQARARTGAPLSNAARRCENGCDLNDRQASNNDLAEVQEIDLIKRGTKSKESPTHLAECKSRVDPPLTSSIALQRMKRLLIIYKFIGGQALCEFMDLCIKACLPDSQHTDIIENYELLMATLTMFRFLKLRQSMFKDEVEEEYLSGKKLKRRFFDPIRKDIALIMSELRLHHKDIVDGHKVRNKKVAQSPSLNVTQILGPKLDKIIDPKDNPEFNEQDEADCLDSTLCRLDLVESILVTTCDLYNC